MALIGLRFYAENVNSLTDMVIGPPSPLSLSLHARAVLGNLGLPELRGLISGVVDCHNDPGRFACNVNYTYKQGEPPAPLFDEARVSAEFRLVWDVPDLPPESLSAIRAEARSLPFLGGNIRHDQAFQCVLLTDSEIPGFLRGSYVSVDHQRSARRILRQISESGTPVDMRDLFRAVAWQQFWKIPDAASFYDLAKDPEFGPFPEDHPLTTWLAQDVGNRLLFQAIGYRQLGEVMANRKGIRETPEGLPHAFAETLYGVHQWIPGHSLTSPEKAWWRVVKPEQPILYLVEN